MNILVVEDEANVVRFLKQGFEEEGFEVETASDGLEAWTRLENGAVMPQVVVADVMMPRMSGIELCEKFRQKYGYSSAFILLTALGTTDDVVNGLEIGADDYIVKPFSFRELLTRVKALIRARNLQSVEQMLRYGDLQLDLVGRNVTRGSHRTLLTATEFNLLKCFLTHPEQVLTRMELLRIVWGKNFDTNTNIVDVYVKSLRDKIDAPFEKKLIHTKIGEGYELRA